jgi:cytochrome b6-f complex iron-sulfur subunit
MQRKEFLQNICYATVGLTSGSIALGGCKGVHYAKAGIDGKILTVAHEEFWELKGEKKKHRSTVLIQQEATGFPIALFKLSDQQFYAVLLRCTHQSCALDVAGSIYTCPCHGSEFSTTGEVLEGPADQPLKTYKTHSDAKYIYVHLA